MLVCTPQAVAHADLDKMELAFRRYYDDEAAGRQITALDFHSSVGLSGGSSAGSSSSGGGAIDHLMQRFADAVTDAVSYKLFMDYL